MPAAKKTARTAATRKTAAAAPQHKRGNLKPGEIKPLVMAAQKAFKYQKDLDLTDGLKFDDWRRKEVMACVGKPGLTACHHQDYRPLLAHFQTLAGDTGAAFNNLLKSGHQTDHADPRDTQEARRQLVHTIAEHLENHAYIATHTEEKILADGAAYWSQAFPDKPQPAPDHSWLSKLRARKAAIAAREKGHLTAGYIVYIARQKTRRPDLKLGSDWKAVLAERCTVKQLEELLYTLVNRINAVEGVQESEDGRNKRQKSPAAKATRKADQEARRW